MSPRRSAGAGPRGRRAPRARGLVAALALGAAAGLASAEASAAPASLVDEDREGDTDRRVAELVAADDARLGAQLAALGPDALPALLAALEQGAVELDGLWHALAPDQRLVVLSVVGRAPASRLQPLFDGLADPAAPPAAKAVALEVVALNGGASDLRTLLVLGATGADTDADTDADTGADAGAGARRALARRLEQALADVLARDPRGYRLLAAELGAAHPSTREAGLRAMGAARDPAAALPLASVLGAFPELDLTVLSQLARVVAEGGSVVVDDAVAARVQRYLDHEDLRARSAAVLVAGRLTDYESIPLLIELLDHPHPGLHDQALWSLQRISGLRLRGDAARWRSWHGRELDWWRDEAQARFAELRSPDPAVAAAAVNAIARHRLYRDALASELTRALAHDDPGVARQACGALRQLAVPAALPALIDSLTDPDDLVREEAWRSLQQITGRELPPDPDAWRDALSG